MKLLNWILAFVFLGFFLTSGLLIIADINNNYSEFGVDMQQGQVNSSFNKTLNSVNQLYNITQDMNEQVVGAELGEDAPSEASFKGAFSAVRSTRSLWGIFGNFIQEAAVALHIPSFVLTFLMIGVTVLVLFSIIAVILRFIQ